MTYPGISSAYDEFVIAHHHFISFLHGTTVRQQGKLIFDPVEYVSYNEHAEQSRSNENGMTFLSLFAVIFFLVQMKILFTCRNEKNEQSIAQHNFTLIVYIE